MRSNPGLLRSVAGRAALAVAAAAVGGAVAIAVSGGGVIEAGAFTLKVRRPGPALLAAAVACAAACGLRGWRAIATDAAQAWLAPGRGPLIVSAVAALAAGATGLVWGTWAASGADAYGYVSQAVMWASGRLSLPAPLAAGAPWADALWTVSPFGWRPALEPSAIVPTYAPGLPLMMAAAMRVIGRAAAFWVVPITGTLAVWWTWRLGSVLVRPWAAAGAAVIMAAAPVFLFQVVQPMSDVPVTAWWTGALAFVLRRRPGVAGVCAAAAVMTRPNLAPLTGWLAAAVWMAAPRDTPGAAGRQHRGWRDMAAFLAAAAPGIGVWLLTNVLWYGHPLSSGYGAFSDLFAAGNIGPNARRYVAWLLQAHGPVFILAAASPVVFRWAARRRPSDAPASTRHAWVTATGLAGLVVCAYLPYGRFDEWSYLRFLLPALPVILIAGTAAGETLVRALPAAVAGAAWVIVVAAGTGYQLDVARDGRAFDLRRLESRYALAGAEAARVFPSTAVALAVQQSGSLRHYAGWPTVRWDLLAPDAFDGALAHLRARGLTPVIVVETWEEPQFRAHVSRGSAIGRLDWPPAVEVDAGVKVRFYRPEDRDVGVSGGDVRTRRVSQYARR